MLQQPLTFLGQNPPQRGRHDGHRIGIMDTWHTDLVAYLGVIQRLEMCFGGRGGGVRLMVNVQLLMVISQIESWIPWCI